MLAFCIDVSYPQGLIDEVYELSGKMMKRNSFSELPFVLVPQVVKERERERERESVCALSHRRMHQKWIEWSGNAHFPLSTMHRCGYR